MLDFRSIVETFTFCQLKKISILLEQDLLFKIHSFIKKNKYRI